MQLPILIIAILLLVLLIAIIIILVLKSKKQRKNRKVYSTFISYSHKDSQVAWWLSVELTYLYIRTFIDRTGIQAAEILSDKIKGEIAKCDSLIFIASPNSLMSKWVQRELDWASQIKLKIIPIEISRIDESQLLPNLIEIKRIDAYINISNTLKGIFQLVHDEEGVFENLNELIKKKNIELFHAFQFLAMIAECLIRYSKNDIVFDDISIDNFYIWSGRLFHEGIPLQECFIAFNQQDLNKHVEQSTANNEERIEGILKILGRISNQILSRFIGTIDLNEPIETVFQRVKTRFISADHLRLLNYLAMVFDLNGTGFYRKISNPEQTVIFSYSIDTLFPVFSEYSYLTQPSDKTPQNFKITIIVISSCKVDKNLNMCLYALSKQTHRTEEIIIVEDCTSGKSSEMIARYGFRHVVLPVPVVRNQYGRRAMCRALGTDLAKGDILIYLDGDVVVSPEFIQGINENLSQFVDFSKESHSLIVPSIDIWMKGSKHDYDYVLNQMKAQELKQTAPKSKIEDNIEGITASTENKPIIRPYGGGRIGISSLFKTDVKHSETFGDLRWDEIKSRCWVLSKQDVIKAGGWDLEFVGYGEEDIELAYRLYQKCGTKFRVLYKKGVSTAHLEHKVNFKKLRTEWAHNGARLIRKHPQLRKERFEFFQKMKMDNLLQRELDDMG